MAPSISFPESHDTPRLAAETGVSEAAQRQRYALAALFSAFGIFGGYLVGVRLIGIDAGAFWGQMQAGVDVWPDVTNGIIKSLVFGVAVSLIAVFEGYDAKPTAEGVSIATTRTVVMSSLAQSGLTCTGQPGSSLPLARSACTSPLEVPKTSSFWLSPSRSAISGEEAPSVL